MKKIKAILCDFDGTLVDDNSNYLPKVKTLIKKILKKNIRFSLATGRAYYSSIKQIESELGIRGIHIVNNGAMIYNSLVNKILFLQSISEKSTAKIIKYLLKNKFTFSLEAKKCVYLSNNVKTKLFYNDILVNTISKFKKSEQILKIVIFAKANNLSESEINSHIKILKNICSDVSITSFTFSKTFGADITSEKATKHTAVLEYFKILHLSRDEVIGIGNGTNDYPLFTACGFNIAMATAPQELKEIADVVVPSVEDGGMVEALEYIIKNKI